MMFKTVELLCKKTMSDKASPVSVVEHYKCNWRSWTWKINVELEGKWDFEWSNTCVNYSCTVFLCKCSQWTERLFTESGCCCWWWWYVGITWTCSSVHRLRSCLELRADFVNSVMDSGHYSGDLTEQESHCHVGVPDQIKYVTTYRHTWPQQQSTR